MEDKIIEALTTATNNLNETLKATSQKAMTGTMTAPQLHGAGGIFSGPGMERDVITAHVRPQGIGTMLPMIPSVSENPLFGLISGYTDVIGNDPLTACEDAPSGYMKGCTLTAQFGLLRRDTNEIEMDKVMLKVNRGDFTDLLLRGRVLGLAQLAPDSLSDSDDILQVVTQSEMVNVGVQAERKLSVDMWQGTAANITTFPGLDMQIATGQVDALSGNACVSLDSDVKDFAYDLVGGTGRDIVEYVSMMEYYLRYNARTMGLIPVTWAVVMRPGLWFELSAEWPCSYLSHRCQNSSGTNPLVINDNVNVAMRDAMREGLFIDINGNRYPVIEDTGIFEHNNINNGECDPGEYASSIYMVPLTITGGFPVCYREYVDYRQATADIALMKGKEVFWTDGGMFSWAVQQINWCYKFALKTEQRVILRTPHLAGKIQHVKYTPLQHLRDPNPNSPYFQDGGVSLRDPATFYSLWNPRQ